MPKTFVTQEEFAHWRTIAAWFYLGLGLVCTFSIAGGYRSVTDTSKDRLRTATEQACVRGNLVRAFLTIDVGKSQVAPRVRQQSALRILPILDCSPLQEGRPPVPMTHTKADAYIDGVAVSVGVPDWRAHEG